MSTVVRLFGILLIQSTTVLAQPTQFKSYHLQDPDRLIAYVDSCTQFWKKSFEPVSGAFYTNVDRQGNWISSQGGYKHLLTQSRNAYAFSRHFQMTGDTASLRYAKRALAFMTKYAWDPAYKGWMHEIKENGAPVSRFGDKTAFFQHYALLGLTAYYEATGDTSILRWIRTGFASNEKSFRDPTPGREGYYDVAKYNLTSPADKTFNSHMDAITTHLISLTTQFPDSLLYKERLHEMGEIAVNRFIESMPDQAIGFCEHFTTDWQQDPAENLSIMGHVLKTAWCLARIDQLDGTSAFLPHARGLADHVLEKGYDHKYGGPYKDYDRFSGAMQMWGNPDTAKAWWQMQQAVMAGLILYDLSGDQSYLTMADESLAFFMRHFVDHTYGEVYSDRERSGKPTWGDQKGNGYKAGYHSVELGYYSWLYGHFYVHRQPVTMYIRIHPSFNPDGIRLYPAELPEDELVIDSVSYTGTGDIFLNQQNKRLQALTGSDGIAKVYLSRTSGGTGIAETIRSFSVQPVYPNPFNPETTLPIHLTAPAMISMDIYDVLGRKMQETSRFIGNQGLNPVRILASNHWASGLYIIRITSGKQAEAVKMILQR